MKHDPLRPHAIVRLVVTASMELAAAVAVVAAVTVVTVVTVSDEVAAQAVGTVVVGTTSEIRSLA